MKRIALFVVIAGLAGVLGAGIATAAVNATHDPTTESDAAPREGIAAAEAPTTRVAVWVDGGGSGSFTLRRGKGITSVTNPSDGTYCIRSNVSGFHPGRVVPVVSVEYSQSETNTAMAQWRSGRPFCPAGTIEIVTFDSGTGNPDNSISFTVVVP